jgi:hypothetical protein
MPFSSPSAILSRFGPNILFGRCKRTEVFTSAMTLELQSETVAGFLVHSDTYCGHCTVE